jgi:hypothetical protein
MNLLFFAFGLTAFVAERSLPTPTFAGKLPVRVESGFAARLDSAHGQYLMSSRGGMLVGFALEHGAFVPRCSLPLPAPIAAPDGGSPLAAGNIAVAGDIDGDGLDELVVGGTRTLRKYELVGGAFALTAMVSVHADSGSPPLWASDVCVGDIDNDGANEVLIAGVDSLTSYATGDYRGQTKLFVCRWKNKLVRLWSDNGTLGLEGPSWVMPITEMRCVCDPANLGPSRLLMKEGASDVSAGMYDELVWSTDGLHRAGYFIIRNDRIQRNVPDNNPANSAIGCDFAQVGGKTATLASVLHEGDTSEWQGVYFVFRGDTAAQHRVFWSSGHPSTGIIVDLDGKGAGVLRFVYPRREGGTGFEFYRL